MKEDIFFKEPQLPYLECRYSQNSSRDFKPHLHQRFSIGAIESGEVIFTLTDKKINLLPGMLALINPDSLHSCNTASEDGRSYFMLYLDPSWCLTVQQTLWNTERFIPVQHASISNPTLFTQYCRTMKTLMDKNVFLLEKEQELTEMIRQLFRQVCHPDPKESTLSQNGIDIANAKNILAGNLHQDLTLAEVARQLYINPYTLIRQFKAATGITPHAYRMNCRIERARQLLQEGEDIADTAYACGFFDQSHLHRHFKSMTTVTPQSYKVNFIQ